jgi:hypothetical protein
MTPRYYQSDNITDFYPKGNVILRNCNKEDIVRITLFINNHIYCIVDLQLEQKEADVIIKTNFPGNFFFKIFNVYVQFKENTDISEVDIDFDEYREKIVGKTATELGLSKCLCMKFETNLPKIEDNKIVISKKLLDFILSQVEIDSVSFIIKTEPKYDKIHNNIFLDYGTECNITPDTEISLHFDGKQEKNTLDSMTIYLILTEYIQGVDRCLNQTKCRYI